MLNLYHETGMYVFETDHLVLDNQSINMLFLGKTIYPIFSIP